MRTPARRPPPAWYGIAAPRLAWALDAVWRWQLRRGAVAALRELDPEQLADIGIEPAEIGAAAHGGRRSAHTKSLHAPSPVTRDEKEDLR